MRVATVRRGTAVARLLRSLAALALLATAGIRRDRGDPRPTSTGTA